MSSKPETDDQDKVTDPEDCRLLPPPNQPIQVAHDLLREHPFHDEQDDVPTLRWWRGSFYQWTGMHWREISDDKVRATLYRELELCRYSVVVKDKFGNKRRENVLWNPTSRTVEEVLKAIKAVVFLDDDLEPPCWVDYDPDERRYLAMQNGLLHIESRTLQRHSAAWFNLFSLPYDYVDAGGFDPEPKQWLDFLGQLWPDDPASIDLLQEWFGYVVSERTDLQKIALMVGPPRSGRGTIARVLRALVGKPNTAGPTLASLASNFGLQPLFDKPLAIVADARLAGTNHVVVERLLSISGEDALTVDRKFKPSWTGKLPTRLVLISNELPVLSDASGAVASRFLLLSVTESWLGREDPTLTARLLEELPDIFLWALDGLDRLEEQGHVFTEPESSRDAAMTLADLVSPVAAFVRERCELGAAYEVTVKDLYFAWRVWCDDHGRERISTEQVFGRDLRAALPAVRLTRPRSGVERYRAYSGLRLRDKEDKL